MAKEAGSAKANIKVSTQSRIWGAMSYMWFLCFIPLFLKKSDDFAMFHAKQGLTIFVAWLFFLVISIVPVLGHIVGFLGDVVLLVFAIMGMIHALSGEYWTMPLLGGAARDLEV